MMTSAQKQQHSKPMTDIDQYKAHIQTLEHELEELTVALSHAWDQLVPFLQEVPSQARTAQDIAPILHAAIAAADTDIAGIYLFQANEWFSVPHDISLGSDCMQQLQQITQEKTLDIMTSTGRNIHWAFAPVRSEGEVIGVLGIGTYDQQHTFTAVDLRIVVRMAERVGNQVAAAQLALSREREAVLAREMQIANEIQQSVQPEATPRNSCIQMAAYWNPAKQVGGDAWGWVQQPDGQLTWFVLDVSGKGLPAALAAVSLHTAIRMALRLELKPTDVLRFINAEFYVPYTHTDLLATVVIAAFDPHTGMLELANAGHPPVLVRQRGSWLHLEATAPPVGVLTHLHAERQIVKLHPDDLIVCYSDGFTEIQAEDQVWGPVGLLAAMPTNMRDVRALMRHIVDAAQRAGTIHDDQTLITAMYTPGCADV